MTFERMEIDRMISQGLYVFRSVKEDIEAQDEGEFFFEKREAISAVNNIIRDFENMERLKPSLEEFVNLVNPQGNKDTDMETINSFCEKVDLSLRQYSLPKLSKGAYDEIKREKQRNEEQERNFHYQSSLLDKELELERLRAENNRQTMEDMKDFYNDMKKEL